MLNTGEVPNLFPHDEREKILQDVRPVVTALGLPETRDSIWGLFIDRVRDNLHICLAMSPVGDLFRNRCRKFPSLINCCTIDWYEEWTPAALLSVSSHFLGAVDLGTDEVKQSVMALCVNVHNSVKDHAGRYFAELRRRYYITPKSYLDLIASYSSTLDECRSGIEARKRRLDIGLGKLTSTNDLVDGMKKQLAELEPVLKEKAAATAELLIQVTTHRCAHTHARTHARTRI